MLVTAFNQQDSEPSRPTRNNNLKKKKIDSQDI